MGDSDDEDFCRYGTPLEPYEEDEVPKKKSAFQDITEQYALDAQGRRRFHGAFTGGFSAGHWNSVSTPEGWTPQTFKSTRSDRMTLNQKPEDFMDDEDRTEFGIAPKQVHTTKEFSGAKRTKQRHFHDGPIPGEPVLQTLLEPVHETVAISILKSMGWRPGRGIGERISYKEKKKAKKLYTCYIPPEFRTADDNRDDDAETKNDDSEDSGDETYTGVLFEPDDFEPYVAKPKVDSFGLGYVGLSRHSILGTFSNQSKSDNSDKRLSHLLTSDKGKKVSIRGQAFGVGALEEEDEDIYSKEDLSSYDFSLDLQNSSKPESKTKTTSSNNRSVLDGFITATTSALLTKVYPAPALPPGYVPKTVKKSRFSSIEGNQSTDISIRDQSLGRHDLTAKQRGNILGENDNVSSPRKNDDKIEIQPKSDVNKTPGTQTLEEKMAAITGRSINFVGDSDQVESETKSENTPQTDGSFKPFASNPSKQERYDNFVAMKKGLPNDYKPDGRTDDDKILKWERERELLEFEQAFKLYKPLTGSMKDRFVTARHQEDFSNPLSIPKDKDYFLYASSERQEAARLGQFGAKTRDVSSWRPDSLLCKRFNVPEPFNGGYAQQSVDKKKGSFSLFEYLEAPAYDRNSYLKEQTQRKVNEMKIPPKPVVVEKPKDASIGENESIKGGKQKRLTVAELFLQEKEKEREKLTTDSKKLEFQKITETEKSETADVDETIDRFDKIDLYKAVFLSGSESEDEESVEHVEIVEKPRKSVDVTPKNIEKNPSPPRGIFANLNFERINSWRKPDIEDDKNVQKKDDKEISKDKPEEVGGSDDFYGPKLPEKHTFTSKATRNDTVEISSSSDSSDWIESGHDSAKKSKSKSKKKSKKKSGKSSKHHKHKTKKKHSRKRSR